MALTRLPLQVVIEAVDKLTAPMRKAQASVAKFFRPLAEIQRSLIGVGEAAGLPKLGKAFGAVRSSASEFLGELGAIGRRLLWIGGIGLGAVVGLAASMAKAGDHALKMSAILGISVEAIQELSYAAKQNEVEVEVLEKSLTLMAKGIGQAARGTGTLLPALRSLGIELRTDTGRLKTVEELLPEVSDRLNDLSDDGRRTALSLAIFGRGGAQLTPLLRRGSDSIAMARDEARRLGIVMSGDTARAADDFGDSWQRVLASFVGFRNVAGAQILPVLTDLANKLTTFVVDHQADIRQFAKTFAEKLPGVLRDIRDLFRDVGRTLGPILRALRPLVRWIGATRLVLVALVAFVGVSLLPSLIGLAGAFINLGVVLTGTTIPALFGGAAGLGGMASAALAAVAPIAAVAAAVLSLGYLAIVVRDNWSALSHFFLDQWETIKFGTIDFVRWLDNQVGAILHPVELIKDGWSLLSQFFYDLWTDIRFAFTDAIASLSALTRDAVNVLPDWLKGAIGIEATPAATPVAERIQAGADAAALKGQATVRVAFENAPKGTRVAGKEADGVDVDLSMGYTMATGQ